MPFETPFRETYTAGDLFYGLDKPRRALMEQLGAKWERSEGTVINFYNIGDYAQSVSGPPDNADFPTAVRSSSNPKHTALMQVLDSKPGAGNNAVWKRKSKAGLWWATQRASKHVHFCLDGFEMTEVVGKCYPGNSSGAGADSPAGADRKPADWTSKSTSITGAELRWLFRNRQNGAVSKHVQFWQDGKACVPPWDQSKELRALWSGYKSMD